MLNIINAILDIICLLGIGANICMFLLYYIGTREMKKLRDNMKIKMSGAKKRYIGENKI